MDSYRKDKRTYHSITVPICEVYKCGCARYVPLQEQSARSLQRYGMNGRRTAEEVMKMSDTVVYPTYGRIVRCVLVAINRVTHTINLLKPRNEGPDQGIISTSNGDGHAQGSELKRLLAAHGLGHHGWVGVRVVIIRIYHGLDGHNLF